VDYEWIEKQLEQFVEAIDRYRRQNSRPPPSNIPTQEQLIEQSAAMEQVVRAIRPETPWVLGRRDHTYTFDQVREAALEALGVVRVREDLARHLDPTGPQLAAAHLHPWAWDSAASLWETRHFRAAVQASATSVDVHLQAKLDCRDTAGTALAREAFTLEAATPSLEIS
jgi:hypothetical protein